VLHVQLKLDAARACAMHPASTTRASTIPSVPRPLATPSTCYTHIYYREAPSHIQVSVCAVFFPPLSHFDTPIDLVCFVHNIWQTGLEAARDRDRVAVAVAACCARVLPLMRALLTCAARCWACPGASTAWASAAVKHTTCTHTHTPTQTHTWQQENTWRHASVWVR
jgi:hypothetical protein